MATTPTASPETPIGYGRMKRKEDARFIRGQGKYLDDIVLPGMLHGAVLRSPFAHAKIVSIDASRALEHPKVLRVITAKDLETLGLAWMPTISYDSQAVLAGDKVRFQGQEVAFVIAEDRYSARDALELIDVEYDPLPAVVNARKALDPDAPVIRDDKEGQTDNLASPLWEAGDAEEADRVFAEADIVVERDMIYPRCHPAPLETCGMIADMNPETGQLDLYNGNQAPNAHRTVYAQVAGLPEHMIRIMTNDIGGGFGNKVPIYPGYVCAIVGTILTGKPVKWVEDRSENLMSTGFARDYVMSGKICAKDGRITGVRVDVIADHGAFDSTAQPSKFPAGFFHIFAGSYDLEAAHCSVKAVYTNKAPGGVAYRCSFRVTEAIYLVERLVGELALKMEADPVELRMKSFIGPEQFPYENKTGWTYDSGEYEQTMREAMRIAGYDDLRREQAEKRERGELMGIGVAFFTEVVGAGPRRHMDILGLGMADGADLRVHADGRAVLSISAQTQGQAHETTFAQIVGRGARHLAGQDRGPPRRHRSDAVRPRHVRQPLDPRVGRVGRSRRPARARQGAADRRGDAGDVARGPRVGEGPLVRQGRSREGCDDRRDRRRGVRRGSAARGPRGRPGGPIGLRPAEPDLSVRRLHLRRRRRPGHRRGQGEAVHRRRRLRGADQPDDRRRADHGRARRGRRDRTDGGDHLRRGGQLPQRVDDGLPHPDRARMPRVGARRHRDPVPASPDRRQGGRRVGHERLTARDRQRRLRRALSVPRSCATSTCR